MQEKDEIQLIKDFSNLNGVPGFETEVAAYFEKRTSLYGKVTHDGIFNSYVNRTDNQSKKPVVQLDAHADSVGFITQAVRPNGLLKFVPLGGWVSTNIPTTKVRIRNQEGKYIKGVVASKPPHFMSESERKKVPEISEMSIDIGSTSREETIKNFKIDTGCPIFVDVDCEYYPTTRLFLGKDFDNRLGSAALVDVLDQLKGEKLAVNVATALSTQEEVGLRGAQVTANKISPDLAIVFEGCPCDDTFEPEWLIQTGLKQGPMLRDMDTSFIANPLFEEYADKIALQNKIPHTRSVRTGGGVNGAAIEYWNGAPTIVIGIPVRYEHTAYNWASLDDFQNAVKLVVAILKDIDADTIANFSKV